MTGSIRVAMSGGGPASGIKPGGVAVFHTRDRGSTAVDQDHALWRPAADLWRDAEGAPIPEQCRIEQATVDERHGALPSRLHRQGLVTGRGTTLLYILFDHEKQLIALRPHLVRVLPTPDGC